MIKIYNEFYLSIIPAIEKIKHFIKSNNYFSLKTEVKTGGIFRLRMVNWNCVSSAVSDSYSLHGL